MHIDLADGARLAFSWRESGALTIELLKPDVGLKKWSVVSATNLTGDSLLQVLETFTLPLFRRALLSATQYPKERG